MAPLILNLGIRWRCVINTTPLPYYARQSTPVRNGGGEEGPREGFSDEVCHQYTGTVDTNDTIITYSYVYELLTYYNLKHGELV